MQFLRDCWFILTDLLMIWRMFCQDVWYVTKTIAVDLWHLIQDLYHSLEKSS